MDTQITLALIGIITAIIGSGWFASVVLRRKYMGEIEVQKAEVKKRGADTDGTEIANAEKTLKIQMEYIVEPLKKEINALRKTVGKLYRALQKISVCPYSGDCPVRNELQTDKDSD